jgi:uncharacterized repeat protein (TIGR02543 family)
MQIAVFMMRNMKTIIKPILIFMLFSTFLCSGCGDGLIVLLEKESRNTTDILDIIVIFDSQSATIEATPSTKYVVPPATLIDSLPTAPVRTGFIFAGWWTAPGGGGTEFTASTEVTANITVYANWTSCPIPTLATTSMTTITGITANSGGNITDQGGAAVSERGVCWSTSANPTISNSKTSDGSGTGAFTSNLTVLNQDTLYYVRAYATNSGGTAYGNELSFNSGKAYGTMYQGGLVFYNDGNGHGLVAQPLYTIPDQSWSNITNAATGATDDYASQANTTAIIGQAGHTNSAAQACDIYSDGTYDDWFLPSLVHLSWMCHNLHQNGFGNFQEEWHWSSTEETDTTANGVRFDPVGGHVDYFKSDVLKVRAARAF